MELKMINVFGILNKSPMKTYLIIFAIIFSLTFIAGVVNSIAEKKDKNSTISNISNLVANGLGIISVFMLIGGLLTIF